MTSLHASRERNPDREQGGMGMGIGMMLAHSVIERLGGTAATVEAPPDQPISVHRLEWEHIQRVLAECDGNISAAARRLNMHRRTLQRKLRKRPVRK